MDFKCCLIFLSLLLAGVMGRPETAKPRPTLPPCTPWCAGQPHRHRERLTDFYRDCDLL